MKKPFFFEAFKPFLLSFGLVAFFTTQNLNAQSEDCVQDNTPPSAVCKDVTVYWGLDGEGGEEATITAQDVDGGSSDNCGIASMNIDNSTFDCATLGPNTVKLYVLDAAGNQASCTSTVTIQDRVPPTIACTAPAPSYTNTSDPVWVTVPTPTIGDNCGVRELWNDYTGPIPNADAFYPVGITTVTWTVFDQSGNATNCVIDVQVIEGPNPNTIPTLSQWGIIALGMLSMIFGVVMIRQRKVIFG